MSATGRWRELARALKRQVLVVYCIARDPRLPWPLRLAAFAIAAYALSPIDLIPDFVPVLGLLDDLIVLPLGIALILRLTPRAIRDDAQLRAQELAERPVSRGAAWTIAALWLLLLVVLASWLWPRSSAPH